MERDHHVAGLREPVPGRDAAFEGPGQRPAQRIDHHIADEIDALREHALRQQVAGRIPGRDEQQIGQPISHDAVDLLGHGPIAAAQPRFHVPDAQAELCRDQSGRQRGIHVAVDEDDVGTQLHEQWLKPLHHRRRLRRVRAGSDPEVVVGRWDPQLVEEPGRHFRIVVLAGVHDEVFEVGASGQLSLYRRQLHEVGPSAHHRDDAHRLERLHRHSTVTLFARFRGRSTSQPRSRAM